MTEPPQHITEAPFVDAPIVVDLPPVGCGREHVAAMIEAATGRSLLGPHDPRAWREERAYRVAAIRAALGPTKRMRLPRNPPADGLKTAAQAAAKLGCSIKTLTGHVAAGELRSVTIGHGKKRPRKRFTDADLDAFIEAQTRKDVACPPTSPKTVARRISTTTSKCEVIGFTARRNARRAAKPKK